MLAKTFEPEHLRQYAEHNLRMKVKVREKEVGNKAFLHVTIYTPHGVFLNGKATDVMSMEISGELEGKKNLVTHYLVQWMATALTLLAPQIERGVITKVPQFAGSK